MASPVFRPIDEAADVSALVDVCRRVRDFGERAFRQGWKSDR
jgi:hypothetical protein